MNILNKNEVFKYILNIRYGLLISLLTLFLNINAQTIKKDSVIIEGIFISSWENSSFFEIRDGEIYSPIWLSFDSNIDLK